MKAVTAKKKQKTGATTSLLSPARAPATNYASALPLVSPTPAAAAGFKRPLDIENEEVQFLGARILDPSTDFLHMRFECKVHSFKGVPYNDTVPSSVADINKKHCDRCCCFICDKPAEECSEWQSHCNAYNLDHEYRKLRAAKMIPQEVTPATPVSRHAKKKVKELKEILRKNGQHVTGKKATLLMWIEDGERYGRLDTCPECDHGRLKVLEHSPGMVMCPGYYEGGDIVPCDFCCTVEDAPRLGPWVDTDIEATPTITSEERDKAEELFKKMKVPQMKAMLQKNGQHITGSKSALLARIVDGYLYGELGSCPQCKVGRLKVNEGCPDKVFCPGHYEYNAGTTVPCSFHCAAEQAPRVGEWET